MLRMRNTDPRGGGRGRRDTPVGQPAGRGDKPPGGLGGSGLAVFLCVVVFFFPFGMLVHLSPLSFLRSWLGVGAAVVLPASY